MVSVKGSADESGDVNIFLSRRLSTLTTHAGMQFAGGLTEQAVAATSLKRRERSPSPRPSKVRPCVDLIQLKTLPTLTSADLTLPAHSAESRRTILRNSTPTRPRVLRGDGYATRTAAAETTRPRRRARGPVQVRV